MSKENSLEKALAAFNSGEQVRDSITDCSLCFESRRQIAEGLYPQKTKNKRKPKPSTPRIAPLPSLEKKSYKL